MIKVINVISDSNIGGAGRMLLVFLKNYNAEKIDMSVILPEGAMLIKELEKLKVRYFAVGGLAEKSFDIQSVKCLKELFKRERPDIVHTHASMSARIAARRAGSKVIYTRHSVFPNGRLKTAFPIKQLYGTVNSYYTDRVIAVSPAAKDLLIEAGQNPKKIDVIYNGVDALNKLTQEERHAVRARYGFKDNDFVCGIFARLTPVKGHEYVISAARRLADKTNIKFIIAGTGEIEDSLKRNAGEMGNIVFTGFLENVESVMGAIDLQLNASYGTEATSLALLEGMSLGIPAVVSSFGGNPYVITDGENGFVFPERDDDALANLIERVYNDNGLYNKLSENSKRIFSERFTSKAMTEQIERLYASILTPGVAR